jgi:hypothetical protein
MSPENKRRRSNLGWPAGFIVFGLFQMYFAHHAQVNHTNIFYKSGWYSPEAADFVALLLFATTGLVMLVVFAPLIAAVVFVVCATIVAILTARQRGFWNGVRVFIKEILFGW